MRVGILTFPNSTSYGASLQMFATYKAVEKMGNDVEIINYYNKFMKNGRHTRKFRYDNIVKRKMRLLSKKLLHLKLEKEFRKFEKEIDLHPKRAIVDREYLKESGKRYSHIICGSDQVWNPNITDSDMSFFLNFCENETKRISYAPSFGIKEFSEEFKNMTRKELEKFHSISVREKEGQHLIKELLGKEVPVVLDPSFLLSKEEWQKYEQEYPLNNEKYILYYVVKTSDALFEFCKELAKSKNAKIIVVGGNFISKRLNKNNSVEYANDIGPAQWLYLMRNADCIVTNSFHGTAFSINFNKDFYVEFSSETNSRLEQIIRSTELEDRIVRDSCAGWDEHVDYAEVNEKIDLLRKSSEDYLKQALSE